MNRLTVVCGMKWNWPASFTMWNTIRSAPVWYRIQPIGLGRAHGWQAKAPGESACPTIAANPGTHADARRRQSVRMPPGCRDESRHGTHECAMPLSFAVGGHQPELWGRRPRLQPAPRPAFREWQALDSSGELRVQGDPLRHGGVPQLFRSLDFMGKLFRPRARVRAP